MKAPKVGDVIVYHDSKGRPANGLVTCVHTDTLVNLVIVSLDESRQDSGGRQTEKPSSIQHSSEWEVHGNYWRWPDEEAIPYLTPQEK